MNATQATRTATVEGMQLHYEVHGQGAPLVLLHGVLSAGVRESRRGEPVPSSAHLMRPGETRWQDGLWPRTERLRNCEGGLSTGG